MMKKWLVRIVVAFVAQFVALFLAFAISGLLRTRVDPILAALAPGMLIFNNLGTPKDVVFDFDLSMMVLEWTLGVLFDTAYYTLLLSGVLRAKALLTVPGDAGRSFK
ncbi:MAG TPA: hypothetical protein VFC63_12775 [Blastocatellia bacterium]|nr:hypothetical protein [Blastocatellia bacterium]